MVTPSTPGAPLFALTLLKALFRLFLSSIFSRSSGSALSLSFHISLNDLDTLACPLCSALSLCKQSLSLLFSIISVIPPFSVILEIPIDSVLHISATMTSADFCMFNNASRHCLLLSRLPMQTSSGTHTFFHSIYLPHLPCMIPCSYWASSCTADLPSYIASYVISVRQTRALPMG